MEVAAQTLATHLAERGVLFARRRVHILQGYPLIDLPPRRFFRRLAGSEAAHAGE